MAAEGVRRFFTEASTMAALDRLSDGVWCRASDIGGLADLLDGAAGELDRTGEAREAGFCRRMSAEVRAYDAPRMDLQRFATMALRAAGFGTVRQVELARFFVGYQEAAVWRLMERLMVEADWERRHRIQAMGRRIAEFVGRLRARSVAIA